MFCASGRWPLRPRNFEYGDFAGPSLGQGFRKHTPKSWLLSWGRCGLRSMKPIGGGRDSHQLVSDLGALSCLDDAAWMLEGAGRDPIRLLWDPPFVDDFVNLDLTALRAREFAKRIPPPGFVQNIESCAENIDAEGLLCDFRCNECGHGFASQCGLLTHLRFSHGQRSAYSLATVTNQCPYCMTIFASHQSARQHLEFAIQRGRCVADRNLTCRKVMEPPSLECPFCDFEAHELVALQWHVRQHLPSPELLVLDGSGGILDDDGQHGQEENGGRACTAGSRRCEETQRVKRRRTQF
jgi:hypothetical protein